MSDPVSYPVLVYSAGCPVCNRAGSWIEHLDHTDALDYSHIETWEGRRLVEDCHDGEYVHAPHLIGDDWYFYGKYPVGIVVSIILAYALSASVWRRLIETVAGEKNRTVRTNH